MRVTSCAKILQRFYRLRLYGKHSEACVVIQRHWRYKKMQLRSKRQAPAMPELFKRALLPESQASYQGSQSKATILKTLRLKIAATKIQCLFRKSMARKRRRHVRGSGQPISKRFYIHEMKIAKLQRFIRKWIFKKNLRAHGKHLVHTRRIFALDKKFQRERTYWHRHLCVLQSKAVTLERQAFQRRESISAYVIKAIEGFENGWKIHEAALLKYELKQAKLTSYEHGTNEEGNEFWQHKKTGEISLKNPGHKYFNHNKKSMRQRAEEKFQADLINRVEFERETLNIGTEKARSEIAR